ncbi:MAG: YbhB/YbcL family Raf kinase inhibitor-like protein [Gammaproteobacteria bacterium]|nr:YbhB/YbcL family Raf kinase inhibitor-like protein [Gammaproteobacteria bacterium]
MKKIFITLILMLFCPGIHAEITPQDNNLFLMKSGSFHSQGNLLDRYTCDGRDISPQLSWEGIPSQTKSLALTFVDLDAPSGSFYHWVIYNIPPQVNSLKEGISLFPPPIVMGMNSWNKKQYNGPCPPAGATHYYVFTLYALDQMLTPAKKFNINQLMNQIQKHLLDKIELGVSYGR